MHKPWKRKVEIGNAVLLLGDSLEIIPVIAGMGGVKHVIGDPPYEDELHNSLYRKRKLRKDGGNEIEALGFDGVNQSRDDFARLCVEVSNGWVCLFTLAEGVRAWRDGIQLAGGKYDTCCFWIKPDSMPRMNGQGPARGAECFVTAWAGRGYRSWNAGGKRGVYRHNVNPGNRDGRHKTEKPISLMYEIIADFTNAGETILDPFLGSGSTGVAAIRMDRPFIGIERDPEFFEIAVERISKANESPGLFMDRTPKMKNLEMFEGECTK